jgi:hypothetical protein
VRTRSALGLSVSWLRRHGKSGSVQSRAAPLRRGAGESILAPTVTRFFRRVDRLSGFIFALRSQDVTFYFPLQFTAGKLQRASANEHRRGRQDDDLLGSLQYSCLDLRQVRKIEKVTGSQESICFRVKANRRRYRTISISPARKPRKIVTMTV